MDLESERSALVSVEDNGSEANEGLEKNDESETKMKDNGKLHAETVDSKLLDDVTLGKTGISVGSSPSPATKGRGLRKWRRIRREAGKDTNSNFDSNKKRGSTALPVQMKERSDGSSSSTNAIVNVRSNALEHSDSAMGGGHDFGGGVDSENSEDRNSRSSSTAASAPRVKHEIPVVSLGPGMNMMSLRGINSGVSVQAGDHQEKNRNATSKKARGVKIKKQNSYSSMESDSRSSNFVFGQGSNSVTSNGRQSGRSAYYDEEYSDDAQNGEKHSNVARTVFSENKVDYEDVSQEDLAAANSWEMKEEKVDDHVGSMNRDPLVESIIPLHSVQEALEREVQKLRDVGKEDPSSSDESIQPSGSSSVDPQVNEDFLKNTKISNLESKYTFRDMETKLEELMKQRIEAEVEYLVISKTTQNLKAGPVDQIKLIAQQKNIVKMEDASKMRNKVRRYALCFIIQSVLLLVVLYLFILRFSSRTMEVIPT